MVLFLLYGLYSLYDEELMVSISTCDAVLDIKHGGGEGGGVLGLRQPLP